LTTFKAQACPKEILNSFAKSKQELVVFSLAMQ
jgi:hypothetical protein